MRVAAKCPGFSKALNHHGRLFEVYCRVIVAVCLATAWRREAPLSGLTPQKITAAMVCISHCCCGTPLSAGIHNRLSDLRKLARVQLSTVAVPSIHSEG